MIALEPEYEDVIFNLAADATLDEVQEALESVATGNKTDWRRWLEWTDTGPFSRPLLMWASTRFRSGAYEALVAYAFHRFLPAMRNFHDIRELFQGFSETIQILSHCDASEKTVAQERATKAIASMVAAAGPAALMACSFAASRTTDEQLIAGWVHSKRLREDSDMADHIKVPDASGGSTTL